MSEQGSHKDANLRQQVLFNVDAASDNLRLDVYLVNQVSRLFPNSAISRSVIQKYIRGGVYVGGGFVRKPSFSVRQGDVIKFNTARFKELIDLRVPRMWWNDELEPAKKNIDIVFEDRNFIVVYKPPGVIVHPGIGVFKDTLIQRIIYFFEKKGIDWRKMERAGLVHRLDKGTSGLLLVAKNSVYQRYLKQLFESHQILKVYEGVFEPISKKMSLDIPCYEKTPKNAFKRFAEGVEQVNDKEIKKILDDWLYLSGFIVRDSRNRKRMKFVTSTTIKSGRFAKTFFYFSCPGNHFWAVIRTGRMHQIRATLRYLGLMVSGDLLYKGKGSMNPDRISLTSIAIGFRNVDGRWVYINKPASL